MSAEPSGTGKQADSRSSTSRCGSLASTLERKVEAFIPLRHPDLVRRLQDLLGKSARERGIYKHLCDRLAAIFHVEHLTSLMKIEDLYATFDPDTEAIELYEFSDEEREDQIDSFFEKIEQILFSAHYHQLNKEEVKHAIEIGYRWGVKLDVDFEVFDRLEIFARGWRSVTHRRRRWQRLFFLEEIEVPVFHRLMMVFRLKESNRIDSTMDADAVYLKMFKDIPETDLEILLPGTKVKLSVLDQGKILLPNLSSAAMTVYKIFRVGVFLSIIAAAWLIKWVLAIAVLVGYFTKGLFSYFNTKEKYQFGLTKSLYLKNLDNNAGVIYRIYNEAEEQEMCESVLAYSMLLNHANAGGGGLFDNEVDQLAEDYLENVVKFKIDFEVHDALAKLARLGLASVDANGKWNAVSLNDASQALDRNWFRIFEDRKFDGDLDEREWGEEETIDGPNGD